MIILRYLLVTFLLFVAVCIAAFVYLEWWQAILVIVATVFAFVIGFKLVIRAFMNNLSRAVLAGFDVKARVLRGATAEVHSIVAVPAPPPRIIEQSPVGTSQDAGGEGHAEATRGDGEESGRPLAYYRIDVTIRPPDIAEVLMTHWDVTDLCVVDFKAPPLSLTPSDETDAGEGFHFDEVQILGDGESHPDEQGKYAGPQRLNVVVGLPPHLRELKFRYYTEQFGRLVLPPPHPSSSGSAPQLN